VTFRVNPSDPHNLGETRNIYTLTKTMPLCFEKPRSALPLPLFLCLSVCLSKWELRSMKTPTADGKAEEEEVVVSERSEGKKLKQKRRKMRRNKTNIRIHISQGIL